MNKKQYRQFGREGAELRWTNYRQHLVEELRKMTSKQELDFYLALNPSNRSLREALMELRKRKNDRPRTGIAR